jgi:hypothetical protein
VHTFHLCNSKYKKYFTYLREGGIVGDDGVREGGGGGRDGKGGWEGGREGGRQGVWSGVV